MKPLRRNTDSYVTVGSALDKTAGLGNEDGLTVTSFSGVWVKESQSSAPTHTAFTPSATASDDWGMVAIGHGGAYQIKIPDSEIDYVGTASLFIWYDAESLPFQHEFIILPADMWDAQFAVIYQKVDLKSILATALTETSSGYLAAAFKKLFDVASPQLTAASKDQTGDSYAIINGDHGCVSIQDDIDTLLTRIVGTLASGTHNAQSGDSYAIANSGTYGLSALKTLIDAITTDTNELQTDLTNGGRLDLLIDAIKAKTDNLPASPAATGAKMDMVDAPNATALAAIKTALQYLETNLKKINDVALEGDGSTTPFGPAT
ncbi:MAG: hypothetical protein ABFD75_12305 [Smithella sp.]